VQRTVQPEILDSLVPDHPDALHNRRDLRLTNLIMGNPRWFARTLPPLLRPRELLLEIGAGTGELSRRLAAMGIPADALDLWPRPAHWPAERVWHQSDLRAFDEFAAYPAVIGNLIFHQFSAAELAALGARLRPQARVILASEPVRRRLSQILYRCGGPLFRANRISLHDAHVSIAAGFRDHELPSALGLESGDWNIRCSTTALGAYRMIAVRRP